MGSIGIDGQVNGSEEFILVARFGWSGMAHAFLATKRRNWVGQEFQTDFC